MTETYTVAIIGLGPAGATLARLLKKDLRVIAIDKKADGGNQKSFQKPCGGLLAPDAQKTLAEMGLNLQKDILVDPQIFSVRTIDLDTHKTKFYQRAYLNMDRHRFDLWLKSHIPENVHTLNNAVCTAVEKRQDGFAVTYEDQGQKTTVNCKYIVGADGANSIVRRTLFPGKTETYMSIQQWFKKGGTNPFYSCVFDKKNTDCYSWSVTKDDYLIFGGAYKKSNAKESFENQKAALMQYGFPLEDPIKTEACLVMRPKKRKNFYLGKNNAFLIGEAAGLISFSSLEGISSALKSGRALAKVLNMEEGNPHKAYKKATRTLRLSLLLKRYGKAPFLYNPLLRRCIMKSGLKTIRVEE